MTGRGGVAEGNRAAGFGSELAVKLTGLTYGQLDYMARTGFLHPSVSSDMGSGSRRQYSFGDLVALRTVAELRCRGVSLQALRGVAAFLRATAAEARLDKTRLVVEGGDVLLLQTDTEALSVLRRPSQHALRFVVEVGSLVQDLQQRLRGRGEMSLEVSGRSG